MKRIIYKDITWAITQDPDMADCDHLVRFYRHNGRRCLLDQIAEWDGEGWSSRYWVPRPPKVPQWLINWVSAHMQAQACAAELEVQR